MVPNDQMSIASITKTVVAAQVMQLVDAGELRLDDLAADRLPPDLDFDTNGAKIVDLLSMRSGIPQWVVDDAALASDWLHVWTAEEKLATVASERGPVGQDWEYVGTNYVLLGLIIEQLTGRSVAEVLRSGVLAGGAYERLIYQPDERPTHPMSITEELGLSAETFEEAGGYLPSLSVVTMYANDGNMASDALSVAKWFRALCAGQIISPASLAAMTDFVARPGYGLGVVDRSAEYWAGSGALGHKGYNHTVALCFQDPVSVVVVLANAEHDVDTLAGDLVEAASTH
jgi:D-alanyl-D-alanine carboxypeptidase